MISLSLSSDHNSAVIALTAGSLSKLSKLGLMLKPVYIPRTLRAANLEIKLTPIAYLVSLSAV
jgi:hypothetical protein